MSWIFNKSKNKYLISDNDKLFSGSGFIIIEKSINPTVLLVETKHNCEDMGGALNANLFNEHNGLLRNAIQEVYEETHCLFDLSNLVEYDNYVDILSSTSYYRCYFVIVKNINNVCNLFDHNNNLLKHILTGKQWTETHKLHKFYFKDLVKCVSNNNPMCPNTGGKVFTLRSRTIKCLVALLKNKNLVDKLDNKHYKSTISKEVRHSLLKNTYVIKID